MEPRLLLRPTHEEIAAVVQQADVMLNALPGFAGLDVSLATVQAGKTLLSANKESLAIAGRWLRKLAEETGSKIYPLDSEASALWQLMDEFGPEALSSITLTCSGGPFYGKKAAELQASNR
jgi:1-deoxy-D-xylulose-5-phosphate reductoisomerase